MKNSPSPRYSSRDDRPLNRLPEAVETPKPGILRLKTLILNAATALDQGEVGTAREILRRALKND